MPFDAETVDAGVEIGYGVAIGDVDGDGRADILLADRREFVWYQNPEWTRHVMAGNLTEHDNVCIAARDIDGDGKVEVAVGAAWNPGDTENSGSVHYLVPQADRRLPWKAVALVHEPVVHRMRWVTDGAGDPQLVVAPLHGRGNVDGNGRGVRLLAYSRPANPESEPWTTTLLDDQFHVTHNFDAGNWGHSDPPEVGEGIVWLGKEGAMWITPSGRGWKKQILPGVEGGGEIRVGKLAGEQRFLATVEPFHGEKLVVYLYSGSLPGSTPVRTVLHPDLAQGHALATGDFLGLGEDQIVVGWRNPNSAGKTGVMIFRRKIAGEALADVVPPGEPDSGWIGSWIDENGMACEDLQAGDLDGDGDREIVAAGRATRNLKIYWNRTK